MPRDGSGTYSRTDGTRSGATTFQQQQAGGVDPTAALFDAEANDMAAAITASVAKDGQTPMTGNLNMNSNKITGLEDGTANGDAVNKGQLDAATLARAFAGVTFADPLTWDVAAAPNGLITVTGDISSLTLENDADGGIYTLRIAMDGTGGHTVTLPAAWLFADGAETEIPDGANAVSVLTVARMGTNYHAIIAPGWATA